MKKIFFLLLLTFLAKFSFSQTKTWLGFEYSYNHPSDKLSGKPGSPFSMVGITYELKKSKWVGFETGLFYRMYSDQLVTAFDPAYLEVDIRQKYISVPVLYKISTKFLNIAIGTNIDYCFDLQTFLGITAYPKGVTPNYYTLPNYETVQYNNPYQKFNFGLIGKLSKEINIDKQLQLEPQVIFSQSFTNNKNYYGFGYSVKLKIQLD